MSKRPLSTVLAILLTISFIAPSAFLVAPQSAHAIPVEVVADVSIPSIKTSIETTISAIQNTITAIATPISAAANVAMQIDAYVLQPLAFVLSGNLMKALTAGVIAFVIGKANGTGAPQFVVDVMKSYQTVADSAALSYLKQVNNTNSPFAGSISSALRNDYLTKSSLSGFWAANMNSLAASSPNVPAYLSGNWSQGGVAAWFALTTRSENNPYRLYQNSQAQLAGVIGSPPGGGGAVGVRAAQLDWGQGFMSWCGASDTATQPAGNNPDEASSDTYAAGNNPDEQSAAGVNPGDPCTNSDGTPGTVKTPGSVIKSTLDKVLGGQQDQIVRMGNVGPQITQILGNVASIMKTVNFAASLLGGSGSGGLFGVDSGSGSNSTSRLAEFQSAPSLGGTTASVYQSAAVDRNINGSNMANQIALYQGAWNTITAATQTASSSVASLASFCLDAANTAKSDPSLSLFRDASLAQAAAADAALATLIAPVLEQSIDASLVIAGANAMILKVQNDLRSGSEGVGSTYAADMQRLQTMPPTPQDVARAQQNAQAFGNATASPAGSLSIVAGSSSTVDQMNLLSANATALKTSVCTPAQATVF
ncbi:MAG: hypothetical protein WC790_01560 [Candidatus Paceibacterota bacterium]|jgi:hypothetical protein